MDVDWLGKLYQAATGLRRWDRAVPLILARGRILILDGDGDDVWEVTVRRLSREDRPPEADFVVAPEEEE